MKIIPLAALKGACRRQRRLVKRQWPDGIPVSMKSVALAAKLELDIGWLARHILVKPTGKAWQEYVKVEEQAWHHYMTDCDARRAHFLETIGKALVRILRKQKETIE